MPTTAPNTPLTTSPSPALVALAAGSGELPVRGSRAARPMRGARTALRTALSAALAAALATAALLLGAAAPVAPGSGTVAADANDSFIWG
ncbi:hypothetical protein [Streptomyces lomondensis]|uniref:Uncharacterized protein n=1 Tax=Streptomyces lomondensis TaxID=68229 RepID=A0ABQ2WXL0_9ACTN|nr:hypothetical protein [Streptomyces lomondensis]MCF0078497.1 hypothetical protein [Streptomyces lomondensis]GGW77889.1 hypothetical protein GCM10010383_01540 [Streptomyces lomondensis]